MQRASIKLHKSPQTRVRILHAGEYRAAKDFDFPRHQHSFWELVYYRSGTIGCKMVEELYPGHIGLVWLTPPGVPHAERALTAYSNYFIGLELFGTVAWPPFLDDNGDRSLGRVCQQIVIECTRQSPERERMLELLAGQLECLLDRAAREKILSHPAQVVARAERLIEEKSGQSLTIQEVADALNVSNSALRSYFQTVRGCSPRDYLQQVRLDKAVRFLRTSTLKLEALAELCGYDSPSHLTRYVKKFTGCTPGEIRRAST